jgi:hypothetical protein
MSRHHPRRTRDDESDDAEEEVDDAEVGAALRHQRSKPPAAAAPAMSSSSRPTNHSKARLDSTHSDEEDEEVTDYENEDDDDDDDDVPSSAARRWKAQHKLKSLVEEVEESGWTPKSTLRGHRARHSNTLTKTNGGSVATSASIASAHSRASSSASHVSAVAAPSPSSAALFSPANGHVDYQSLPLAARLEYEENYARKWKTPMAILVDQMLARYTLLPKRPPPPDQRVLHHSLSAIDTNSHHSRHSSVHSEDFDAELAASPNASSPLSSSILTHPAPRHYRSASSMSASPHSAAQRERERDEAERHSLAKGKLKIQAALLRRKQLDWQRQVDAGETTWERLEQEEAEQERKNQERHQEKHRNIVSRIIDPRDHSAQRRADIEASEARMAIEREQRIEWYWNSIPIAAVALMRVLVHNHAFDACLPPPPPADSANARMEKRALAAEAKQELCRTWLLSDLLYAIRTLLIAIVANEPEPVSPTALLTPRNGGSFHLAAPSPSMRSNSSATVQQSPEQVQARLVWLLNNIVVLLHLTKRLALQRQEESRSSNGHERSHSHGHGHGHTKKHAYVPHFAQSPADWPSSVPVDFPSVDADGAESDQPLKRLSADVGAYVFEMDYDQTSDNPMHWFYCWLLRLARVTSECLLQHIYTHTPLHTLHPSTLLHPSELMELGSDTLDGVIEVLGSVYEATTDAGLLNLLKTQLIQALLEQFSRGVLRVVLTDPHLKAGNKSHSQRLLAQAVPLGMKLSMVYSGLEDWSQRCTAFAHPFVQATRLTLAPLKEACMFCLLDEKSELDSLDAFEVLTPSMPRPLLLALCDAYNALPNNDDQVSARVIKQLRKRIEKDEKEAAMKTDKNINGTSSPLANGRRIASSPSAGASSSAMPVLSPFLLSLDLSSQLGKFILSAVELPDQLIAAHPAFQFLKKEKEPLVL